MILKTISVLIWLLAAVSVVAYVPIAVYAFNHSDLKSDVHEVNVILVVVLSVFAAIEILLSVVIRYFALVRPAKRGAFALDSLGGGLRFFLIHLLNWFIAESVALYGMVLYFMYGKVSFLMVSGLAGLGALIYHFPRFKPFQVHERSA